MGKSTHGKKKGKHPRLPATPSGDRPLDPVVYRRAYDADTGSLASDYDEVHRYDHRSLTDPERDSGDYWSGI